MLNILVLGATGYIGGRLVPRLTEAGHQVMCLVRDRAKAGSRGWGDVRVTEGDILDMDSLRPVVEGIDVVYYLVHSMTSRKGDFVSLDRQGASNVVTLAEEAGVKRIIYLGGLGRRERDMSDHLRSRHEVADVLRSGIVPVTEFRAAAIMGSGSASFEIIHHLVNRLPIMICPSWVFTRTQPIGISDVLDYLVEAATWKESAGKVIDIGGPDIVTYGEMMKTMARILDLKRVIIPVPLLTPRLSSYWVSLFSPVPYAMSRSLVESLKHETVCENDLALMFTHIKPKALEETITLAFEQLLARNVETRWSDSGKEYRAQSIDQSHIYSYSVEVDCDASPEKLFEGVQSIGGDNGWYYLDRIWKLRGIFDKLIGGVGLRRGRRDQTDVRVGETLDFWRVEEFIPNKKLGLLAEMKLPGIAWLYFEVSSRDGSGSTLKVTANYYPHGLLGYFYWFALYPIHGILFRGLARSIIARAESS